MLSVRDIPGLCLSMRVKLLHRAVDQVYEAQLRPLGLGPSQLTLLVAIEGAGTRTAAELSRRLLMEKSTLSRTLERMRRAGWMAESGGPDLRLSPAGVAKLEEALPAWQRAQEQAEALLGEDFPAPLADAVQRIQRRRASH